MQSSVHSIVLAAAAVWAIPACAGRPVQPEVVAMVPGRVVVLKPGQRARLPDGRLLTYLGLRSDSRCPERVVCVHAGWAEIDVRVHDADGAVRTVQLSTRHGVDPVPGLRRFIELVDLGRGASPPAHLRAVAAPE